MYVYMSLITARRKRHDLAISLMVDVHNGAFNNRTSKTYLHMVLELQGV